MKRSIAATWALCASTAVAVAQDPAPSLEAVNAAIQSRLPHAWQVMGVEVTASVNKGDAIDPKVRQRFVATVSPTQDLLLPTGAQVGPFTVATRTVLDADEKKLHGTLSAPFRGGEWIIDVSLENDLTAFGSTEMAIPGPVVIAGTEDAKRKLAEVADAEALKTRYQELRRAGIARIAKARADLSAEMAKIDAQGRAATAAAKASTAKLIDTATTKAATDLAEAEQAARAKRARVAALNAELTSELQQIERRTVARAKAFEAELEALDEAAKAETEKRKKELAEQVAAIRASSDIAARLKRTQEDTAALKALIEAEKERARQAAAAEVAKGERLKAQVAARAYSTKALLDRLEEGSEAERRAALATIDETKDIVALDAAFDLLTRSKRPAMRDLVAEMALQSGNAGLRRRAVNYILKSATNLTVHMKSGAISYSIPAYIAPNGTGKSDYNGAAIYTQTGTNGVGIRMNGGFGSNCVLAANLTEGRKMVGSASCYNNSTSFPFKSGRYVVSATLP